MKAFKSLEAHPPQDHAEHTQAYLWVFKLAVLHSQVEVITKILTKFWKSKDLGMRMALFLIKNKNLFNSEEIPNFNKLMELILLLTCLKF